MDSIELARQAAAELHTRATALGHDPWDAYAFAVAEARRRDVDVEPTAQGAALLNGARATFIRREHLILHERAGSSFEHAFLVAHELGHIVLGDDTDGDPALEIDPPRSAEPSPVGFDRVVDYGRRQRREIQMDLFAREFLLPRAVARRLHLKEQLTASEIARRLGAPFDVVAQQLLDALLLPEAFTGRSEPRTAALNDVQSRAARHDGEAYLLEAGPGTGKTQTLTARVTHLLERGVDPRRVLVLTFSNKAAGEIAERIARTHKDAAAAMWIGTFHAFGLDIIRRFHCELGLPKDPQLMDRTEAVELLEDEFPRLALRHYRNVFDPTQRIGEMLAAISRAKDEVVDAAEYRRLASAMPPSENAEKAVEVATVYDAYEAIKRAADRIDFGDLVALPVQLLERQSEVRVHLQSSYDHVLVDEYQDVNRSSVRLLAALKPDGRNLWVVGDAKQSIYRFRGASSFNMTRFGVEDFPNGKRERLTRNYRSRTEIVDAFSEFAIGMRAGDSNSSLEADRGPSGEPLELRTMTTAAQQAPALAAAIEEMRVAGHCYRDQAVLCTGNEKLAGIGRELERLGIPVLFLGSLFERSEVKDLLALLSLLVDRRAMGLARVACSEEFAMSFADVNAVIEYLRREQPAPATWLDEVNSIPSVSTEGQKVLAALGRALKGFSQSSHPWTALATFMLDRTRLAARLGASTDSADRARGIALWQFMNFARVQPARQGPPVARLLHRVRRLVRLGDDRDLRQLPFSAQSLDAVRLLTMHGAKGLEFPAVHIPGLNADTIPRTPAPPACPAPDGMVAGSISSGFDEYRTGQQEEQECLFFVALSRAQDRLVLYVATETSNGRARAPSPFLSRLGRGLRRTRINEASLPPLPAYDESVQLEIEGGLQFEAAQISLYENCPRRFFYTHILQVGGRRVASTLTKLHDALQSVLKQLVDENVRAGADDLEARLTAAFNIHGLDEHGHRAELATIALAMVRYFLAIRAGLASDPPVAVRLAVGAETITALPEDVLLAPTGERIVRRVRTGHRRSGEEKSVAAAAFVLAAREAFPDAVVEFVHLADATAERVALSEKELRNRQEKLAGMLENIRSGRFPATPSAFTCPGCPAFFICGPTPSGPIRKKFS